MTNEDWKYTDDKLKLRGRCIQILMHKFGNVDTLQSSYSTRDIYECAHEWVSQGNKISDGIVAYFNAYYNHENKKGNQIHT
tara:strand:- start:45 stop:287 length:243 start_codon:yes stop_codon:yes gene_type:complete